MTHLLQINEEYKSWITTVSKRFKTSQIRAAVKVNEELLKFYWELGRDISSLKRNGTFTNEFYTTVSTDLKNALPDVKSFSPTNIKYFQYFYELYASPQLADLKKANTPQTGNSSKEEPARTLNPQLEDSKNQISSFINESIFKIPWGHQRLIIDKCKNNPDKALFYVQKTLENTWSRSVLLNFLNTDLYERQGKALTKFTQTLPQVNSDLAQELTKDPYNFDFLSMTESYKEKELKNALIKNIEKFLMELGTGFAYMGREFRLEVGGEEKYLDMLFYNVNLHCYVVIEVKVEKFDPAHLGQLGFYVSAVNHLLKKDSDNPTLGLLICKDKDDVVARYSLETVSLPIGISEYDLQNIYPTDFKSSLPSIEDIEKSM